jgi:hypothetical protein
MERRTPPPHREPDTRLLALCEDHLTREETLLAEHVHSLRQVREAFCQRNLSILPTLQGRQEQLAHAATEMAAAREDLRATLADLLGVSPSEATLRAAALALAEPARGRLLQRHARLTELVRQADQLGQHNAALLGYARGFFDSLFAELIGTCVSERYGPDGERRTGAYGSFLEARV